MLVAGHGRPSDRRLQKAAEPVLYSVPVAI